MYFQIVSKNTGLYLLSPNFIWFRAYFLSNTPKMIVPTTKNSKQRLVLPSLYSIMPTTKSIKATTISIKGILGIVLGLLAGKLLKGVIFKIPHSVISVEVSYCVLCCLQCSCPYKHCALICCVVVLIAVPCKGYKVVIHRFRVLSAGNYLAAKTFWRSSNLYVPLATFALISLVVSPKNLPKYLEVVLEYSHLLLRMTFPREVIQAITVSYD